MDAKLKVAIVGSGGVSRVHAGCIRDREDVSLVAAVDIKPERAERVASKYGGKDGAKAFTDHREILDMDIDVVHICTPHYTHARIALDFLRAGKNVLTEKPMAISLHDADEMIHVAQETGKSLGVIFQNRYNTASQEAYKVIQSGKLGKILGSRAFVTWFRPQEYYTNSDWKGTWSEEGGGVLIDQAIHTIDLMQWLVGPIDWLQGSMGNRTHPYIEVEDVAEALVGFKNGAHGLIYAANYFSYDADILLEIHGEKGKILIEKDKARILLEGEEPVYIEEAPPEMETGKSYWGVSHRLQIAHFYEHIRKGERPWIDGCEGRKALEIVLGIYHSARHKGARIQFPTNIIP